MTRQHQKIIPYLYYTDGVAAIEYLEKRYIPGLTGDLEPRQELSVRATRPDGSAFDFKALARLDSKVDILYYKNGGILHTVLRSLLN